MRLTVNEIAALVQGKVLGDGARVIEGVAGLEEASPRDITFVRDISKAATMEKFRASSAGAVIVPAGVPENGRTLVEVKNPIAAFSKILSVIAEEHVQHRAGIHPQSVISPKAKIGHGCEIGPFVVIEEGAVIGDNVRLISQVYIGAGSKVGKDCVLHPQVVVRENVTIGERCLIHAGAVIGADGFGFFVAGGKNQKIPQIGTVIVEDDVEIGACTTIDRATLGATVIGRGTKLDNLVQVAHNVTLGPECLMAAQSGVAGSTLVGKNVVVGGQSGIADHLTIGDATQIGAKSGVMQDAGPRSILFGVPAQPIRDALKQSALMKRLASIYKDLKKEKS